MAKTMNCVIHHSKIQNRWLLIRDSRDTEDRIKSCYKWKIKCLHHIDRSSLEMKLVHELIKEFIYNCFLINDSCYWWIHWIWYIWINEFISFHYKWIHFTDEFIRELSEHMNSSTLLHNVWIRFIDGFTN